MRPHSTTLSIGSTRPATAALASGTADAARGAMGSADLIRGRSSLVGAITHPDGLPGRLILRLAPLPALPPLGTSRAAGTLGGATEATLQLRAYLRVRGAAVVDLAGWLGGPAWERHARELVQGVLGSEAFKRRTRTLIEGLWRLFSLRLVDDLESAVAGRFVCLDPQDERVARCCEYAELLERTHLAIAAVDIAGRRAKRRVHQPTRRVG